MRSLSLFGLSIFLASPVLAQTTIVGDALVLGSLTAGTTTASTARLEVKAGSATTNVFQVSGVDGTPFLGILPNGKAALGVTPEANADLNGSADDSSMGIELRSGNNYPDTGSYQMTLGYNGTTNLRHAVKTSHSTHTANSGIDFFLWTTAVSTTVIGTMNVLSLVTISTQSGVSMHVMPSGTPDVEVEVSNGASTGGGDVIRASEGTHSSRALKTNISYLPLEAEKQAYEDVKGLNHATFRYLVGKKGKLVRDSKQPLRRGLIYEEAPGSVRGSGQSIVFDERLSNVEMAFKELARQLEAAQAKAARLEASGR